MTVSNKGEFRDCALFRKSSFSEGGGDCVEVARVNGWVAVRDSKDPNGPVLWFTPTEWDAFVYGVLAGEFGIKDVVVRWISAAIRIVLSVIT
ncbi:DUF397 domain-containing protein [Nocardia sp. NPDC046473]|uniref:DUF397 domain-containing protein n=1 Tax=Nocardia sp. NPDC046473 TaxID=3155733 RepID=UPI0033C0F783